MTPRPTTLTFTPWAVLYPTTTTPADAAANPRTGPYPLPGGQTRAALLTMGINQRTIFRKQ